MALITTREFYVPPRRYLVTVRLDVGLKLNDPRPCHYCDSHDVDVRLIEVEPLAVLQISNGGWLEVNMSQHFLVLLEAMDVFLHQHSICMNCWDNRYFPELEEDSHDITYQS